MKPKDSARLGPDGVRETRRRRTEYNRILLASLVGSALAHFALIALYPLFLGPDPQAVQVPRSLEPGSPEVGTVLVSLLEIADEPAEEATEPPPPVPEPEEAIVAPLPVRRGPEAGAEGDEAASSDDPPGLRALAPQLEDSLIWREVDARLSELTPMERARLELAWDLTDWNEASEAERRAAAEALDWTHTDSEGRRWGVSPGKLHLGNLTLPLPLNFGRPPGVDPAADRALLQFRDIDRAAARAEVAEARRARAEAMRKRRDAERADTTRIR